MEENIGYDIKGCYWVVLRGLKVLQDSHNLRFVKIRKPKSLIEYKYAQYYACQNWREKNIEVLYPIVPRLNSLYWMWEASRYCQRWLLL